MLIWKFRDSWAWNFTYSDSFPFHARMMRGIRMTCPVAIRNPATGAKWLITARPFSSEVSVVRGAGEPVGHGVDGGTVGPVVEDDWVSTFSSKLLRSLILSTSFRNVVFQNS
jgi:hypothetical protein